MTKTVTRLYDSYDQASRTVRDLEAAGYRDVSIVSNNSENWYKEPKSNAGDGAAAGAGLGAAAGGGAGLLAGLGILAIPGVGPVVAAGWLAATAAGALAGAAAGAATGGIVGSLTESGVSKDDAHIYAEGVRRGGTLVTARVDDTGYMKAEAIVNAQPYVDAAQRAAAYRKAGWLSFDEKASPYSADQIKRERDLYRNQ